MAKTFNTTGVCIDRKHYMVNIDNKLNKIVRGRVVSVEEKIGYIRNIIKEKVEIKFKNIISTYEKDEIIATFLSLLELIKSKEISVEQDIFFDDILIKKNLEY